MNSILTGFSCLPESNQVGPTPAFLFGIAPDKAFLAFRFTPKSGGLLHHHFTFTPKYFEAVYFCGAGSPSPRLPVKKYPALWCSDFPSRTYLESLQNESFKIGAGQTFYLLRHTYVNKD